LGLNFISGTGQCGCVVRVEFLFATVRTRKSNYIRMSGSLLFYAYPYSVYATVLFVFSLQSLAAQHPILPDTQMPQSYRLSRACLGKLNEWMSLCSRPFGIKGRSSAGTKSAGIGPDRDGNAVN
jgi:hypothetical protein